MSPVAYIAQLLGIYTVLIGGVMFVRRQAMLEIMTAIIDRRPLIFILANLRVLIGLAIVLITVFHSVVLDLWRVGVTLSTMRHVAFAVNAVSGTGQLNHGRSASRWQTTSVPFG